MLSVDLRGDESDCCAILRTSVSRKKRKKSQTGRYGRSHSAKSFMLTFVGDHVTSSIVCTISTRFRARSFPVLASRRHTVPGASPALPRHRSQSLTRSINHKLKPMVGTREHSMFCSRNAS